MYIYADKLLHPCSLRASPPVNPAISPQQPTAVEISGLLLQLNNGCTLGARSGCAQQNILKLPLSLTKRNALERIILLSR